MRGSKRGGGTRGARLQSASPSRRRALRARGEPGARRREARSSPREKRGGGRRRCTPDNHWARRPRPSTLPHPTPPFCLRLRHAPSVVQANPDRVAPDCPTPPEAHDPHLARHLARHRRLARGPSTRSAPGVGPPSPSPYAYAHAHAEALEWCVICVLCTRARSPCSPSTYLPRKPFSPPRVRASRRHKQAVPPARCSLLAHTTAALKRCSGTLSRSLGLPSACALFRPGLGALSLRV